MITQISRKWPIVLTQQFSSNGDGTGITDVVADYSVVNQEFSIRPNKDQIFIVGNISVSLIDNGNINANGYGASAIPLTNGLLFSVQFAGISATQLFVKTNYEYQTLGTNFDILDYQGAPTALKSQINYTLFGAGGIRLEGVNGDFISITAQDDFSSLIHHGFTALGYRL